MAQTIRGSMSGFTATGAAINDLGSAFTHIADAVEGLDVAGPLTKAGAALPGSQTEVAVAGTSVKLAAAVRVVGEHVRAMAVNADETARSYETVDARTHARFGRMGVR